MGAILECSCHLYPKASLTFLSNAPYGGDVITMSIEFGSTNVSIFKASPSNTF